MAPWMHGAVAAGLLLVLGCRAELPSAQAFEAAVAAARPLAAAHGLSLRTDGLWLELLRARAPMLAQRRGEQCHIAYTAYTPGHGHEALFPALSPEDAALWLAALVHHELAHCLDRRIPRGAHPAAVGSPARRQSEALADLSFALYLDRHRGHLDSGIAVLAQRRAEAASMDPDHDTAAVLHCYLAHPARQDHRPVAPAYWLDVLLVWQARCPLP